MANQQEREQRIQAEKKRLNVILSKVDKNKLKTVETLIDRAAFITISLQDLEAILTEKGWTEEYFNGRNQSGIKTSSEANVHISLTKNLSSIMKQLIDIVPEKEKCAGDESDELADFLKGRQKRQRNDR